MRGISRIYTVVGFVLIIIVSLCFPTDVYNQNEASKHLASANASQPQGLIKEPHKVEQSISDKIELNKQLLQVASSAGNASMKTLYINNLLNKGADINAVDEYGLTSLHHAAQWGDKDIITLLRANGASVECKDNAGRTPLHYAAGAVLKLPGTYYRPKGNSRNAEVVKLLVEKGADVNLKDKYGLMPLHYATVDQSTHIMELLLNQGVHIDIKDNAGRTALHYAAGASRGSAYPYAETSAMARLLLTRGADINVQDKIGWTPLHYAAYIKNQNIVKYLVQEGADKDIVDRRGSTAYSWNRAKEAYFQELAQYDVLGEVEWSKYRQECEGILGLLHKADQYDFSDYKKQGIDRDTTASSVRTISNGVCFVSPDGQDTNPGTLEHPFTLVTAVGIARPGDIIFMREGVYHCQTAIQLHASGTQGKPICIRSYPGETPILDFSEAKGDSILITGAYWHLKGLTITRGFRGAIGIHGNKACYNVLEQIKAYDNRYLAIRIEGGAAYNILLNCDSYHNFDFEWNGEDSDGFGIHWWVGQGNIFIGTRAWSNSDDGYDCWRSNAAVLFEKCYAWNNGEDVWNHPFFTGNGNGFKLGKGSGRHVLIDCLAWNQGFIGVTLNGNTSGVTLRNCTAWNNKSNYYFESKGWSEKARRDCVFDNNISHNGHTQDSLNQDAKGKNNSWNAELGLTLTDADFVSLDDSMMSAPRNPDGSIPENNFLKLAPGSKAIDKGVDIGMPFVGQRPDLGAFEYDPNAPNQGYVKMLHQAVRDHDLKQIEQLLAQGEGINDKDWLGYTPLHWAVYFGYPDLVELLISKGADPDIQSDTGRYALEIARAMAYPELEVLLCKLGAKAGDVSTNEGSQETKAAEEQKTTMEKPSS